MTDSIYLTGLGVVSPNGLGIERYWDSTLRGRSGITGITRFDTSGYPVRAAGQVLDFDPAEHLPNRLLPQTDVSTRFALAAADWALGDAAVDLDTFTDYETGVVTANAQGGFEFTHREFNKLWSQGSQAVSAYESFAWFYAVNTGQISIRNGMRGPSSAMVAEQAGGLDAIGHARRTIRRGAKLVLTGGVDSALDPWGWVSQLSSGRISHDPDLGRAYRPFDSTARGYLPGEGGAILTLENAQSADERQAPRRYGEIVGYASTFDPPPDSNRPPALRRAIEQSLLDAGMQPSDVDVVFADASGVADLDRAEAKALTDVFGASSVPVTAPKTLTGRLYAGGGPLDVAAAALSMRHGVIPPTAATEDIPAEYGIDLVLGQSRACPIGTALILARGKGGFNSAIILRAVR